tara:strand:+ start:31478 stop:31717 length:240 start_codon:yes stop_codon:yes gene_type:complete
MTGPTGNRRPILIGQVNLLWYLPALAVLLAVLYAALANRLPVWVLPLLLFALFMWLFSFAFAVYAVIMRKLKERKEPRP